MKPPLFHAEICFSARAAAAGRRRRRTGSSLSEPNAATTGPASPFARSVGAAVPGHGGSHLRRIHAFPHRVDAGRVRGFDHRVHLRCGRLAPGAGGFATLPACLICASAKQRRIKTQISHVTPSIAAIRYDAGFDINRTLQEIVVLLRERGFEVGGVLQRVEAGRDRSCAPLNIVDIRSGETARITQDRGKDSRGCKLDPRGLAEISHCIKEAVDARVDLIIINKFGRAESERGGLLSCIAEAATAGIPVLTTVREPYLQSWHSFHGGLAIELSPYMNSILKWFYGAREWPMDTSDSAQTSQRSEF